MERPDSLGIGSYDARLCDVCDVGLDDLQALSLSVGWPHRRADWKLLREFGQGFAALDEIGRVIGSSIWFPYGAHDAGIGMVITVPRLQANGTGLWLMGKVLERTEGRSLRLNATRAAERLFSHLGFRRDRGVFQHQGVASQDSGVSVDADGVVRPLEEEDESAVLDLDAQAFGALRDHVLRGLIARSNGVGLFRGGTLAAFALCREFGRGRVVGPVVAGTDRDAVAVVAPHVRAHAGRFLRVDTHTEGTPFAAFLSACGLQLFDTVSGMSLHGPVAPVSLPGSGTPATYALASQAFG